MKRLFLFSHDPGGANVIVSLINNLSNTYSIELYGNKLSLDVYKKAGFQGKDISQKLMDLNQQSISKLLSRENFDGIITSTSAQDYTERQIWKAAKKQKIYCIAILDQWVNYSLRFLKKHLRYQTKSYFNVEELELPNAIMVMDKYAKEKMIVEGFPENKLIVTGNPYFEYYQNKHLKKPLNLKPLRHHYRFNNYEKTYLFASEPITSIYGNVKGEALYGYTELTIVEEIARFISKTQSLSIQLVIKSHPKDKKDIYQGLLSKYPFIKMATSFSTIELISTCDAVIGMSSTLLLEAALLEKPILSVQIGLTMNNPFYLNQTGFSKSIETKEQLENSLSSLYNNPESFNLTPLVGVNSIKNICNNLHKNIH